MKKKIARDFFIECISQVLSDGTSSYIENPAIQFAKKAQNGGFDSLSEEEYDVLLGEVTLLARLFNNRSRRPAGNILLEVLDNAPMGCCKLKEDLADLFSLLLTGPDDEEIPLPYPETIQAMEDYVREQAEEVLDAPEERFDHTGEELPWVILETLPPKKIRDNIAKEEMPRVILETLPPKKIRDNIAKKVIGQPEAVKAAAMIVYNHLSGRRTNAVFAGPSGCGKSEIWRTLSKEYPGLVRMVDFSRFSAEGWSGSLHLRDIFEGANPAAAKRHGLIVVLDEADKILCERAIGGGGTNYNELLQNDLLKMMDGDVIEFGENNKKDALSVDCSKVSVVMLGAFERLLADKSQDAKHIGFGAAPTVDAGGHKDISYDDLIHAGMRLEIAGRVNKIIALEQLSVNDYKSILRGPMLSDLLESTGCIISIDSAAGEALAEQAIESGLGARWMQSEILNAIDDARFDDPEAKVWAVTLKEGRLCCRARKPRKSGRARMKRDWTAELPF